MMKPLSFDEHRELGRELLTSRARLGELAGVVTTAYGEDNASAVQFRKLIDAVDGLREQLESQARQDFPNVETRALYR